MNAQKFEVNAPNLLGLSDALETHLLNSRRKNNVFESAELATRWSKVMERLKSLKKGENLEVSFAEAEVLALVAADRYYDVEPIYVLRSGLQHLRGLAYLMDFNAAPAPIDITPEVLAGAAEGLERFIMQEELDEGGSTSGQTKAKALLKNIEDSLDGGDEMWELNHEEFVVLKGAVEGRKTMVKRRRRRGALVNPRHDSLDEELWEVARTMRTYGFLLAINAESR